MNRIPEQFPIELIHAIQIYVDARRSATASWGRRDKGRAFLAAVTVEKRAAARVLELLARHFDAGVSSVS